MNRVAVVGLACAAQAACGPDGPPRDAVNVLLVVLDTTRADALGVYGAAHARTPALDKLAAEGVVFTNARTVSAWTLPAHASLFTGLYPSRHGADWESPGLLASVATMAELLAPTHETGGFCENPHIIATRGFTQGFTRYEETWRRRRSWDEPPITLDLFEQWLEGRDRGRPFFAFINLMTPHLPYRPPQRLEQLFLPDLDAADVERLRAIDEQQAWAYIMGLLPLSAADLRHLRALYDAEVAFADEQVARILAGVAARGELERTLVIVVGDHGENIGDHGLMQHQLCLYESLLRVPLILRHPRSFAGGARRDGPVQLVDVLPTVLQLSGVPRERWPAIEGHSLLDGDPPPDRPVIGEYTRPAEPLRSMARVNPGFDPTPYDRRLRSILLDGLKLIASDRGENELYDLAADPDEQHDLAAGRPGDVARLRARLEQWTARAPVHGEPFVAAPDPEAVEAIRELGYID